MFEKTNNPDVNPNLKLKEQNQQVLDRLIKNIKHTNIGLQASSEAARNGLTFIK